MKYLLLTLLILFAGCTYAQTSRNPLFTSFDGTQIHYDTLGQGKPVVLLHGFIVNGESWKRAPVRQALANAGFRVITLDLRGNGQSDKPHQAGAYRNDAEVKDIMALMKHLKLAAYDAVGYSRGAILAAKLMTLDKHLRRAVMGGMSADFTDPNWSRRLNFLEALTKPGSHPELQGAIDYAKRTGADTVALVRLQAFQPRVTRSQLHNVRRPLLVVNGDRDRDNGDPQSLVDVVPGAKLVIVPGNHNETMLTPEFAKAVVDFLRE